MSEKETNDSKENPAKARSFEKPTMILVAVALVLTLANTALIVMNPTAKKVEQFNEELKTDLAESVLRCTRRSTACARPKPNGKACSKKPRPSPTPSTRSSIPRTAI